MPTRCHQNFKQTIGNHTFCENTIVLSIYDETMAIWYGHTLFLALIYYCGIAEAYTASKLVPVSPRLVAYILSQKVKISI